MPNSYGDIIQQTLRLIAHAFYNAGSLVEFLFVGLLRVSPLPDEVDFLLVCLLVLWLISLLVRLVRGK